MSSEIKNKRPSEPEELDLDDPPENGGKKPDAAENSATPVDDDAGVADAAADAYETVDPAQELSLIFRREQGRDPSAGLDSEYPPERQAARSALIARADSWTPENLKAVATHLDPDMVRSLSTLPKDSAAKKAVIEYAETKLKSPAGLSADEKEGYVQALVCLSGLKDPAQLNERFGQLGVQFAKDKQKPPALTATLADKTKLEFKEYPDGALKHSYTRRPDRHEFLNTLSDKGELLSSTEAERGLEGGMTYRDAQGNTTFMRFASDDWIDIQHSDGAPSSFTNSRGVRLDSKDGGKTWVDAYTGKSVEGKLSVARDGTVKISGPDVQLTYGSDQSCTRLDKKTGETTKTAADGTSITKNAQGLVTSTTDARGQTTAYEYGPLNELTGYSNTQGEWSKQADGTWKNAKSGATEPRAEKWVGDSGALHTKPEAGLHKSFQLDGSTFTYDGKDRVIERLTARGTKLTFGYTGDEKQPSWIDFGNSKWIAQNAEKTSWKKEDAPAAEKPWLGKMEVNHETAQLTETSLQTPGRVTQWNSDSSRIVRNKDQDIIDLTTARGENYQFEFSAPHKLAKATRPDGSVSELTSRGWRTGNAVKSPAIEIDFQSGTIRESRSDGNHNIIRTDGSKAVAKNFTHITQSEDVYGVKTEFQLDSKNHVIGKSITKPTGEVERFLGQGVRELQRESGTVKYDAENRILKVTPKSGYPVTVERAPDGTITTIGNAGGMVWDLDKANGDYKMRGSNGEHIKGQPYINEDGEFGFVGKDGKMLTIKGDSIVFASADRSLRTMSNGSMQGMDKSGNVDFSQDAKGVFRSVVRDKDKPDRLLEVNIGERTWTRSTDPKKENEWTSNDGQKLNGNFAMDRQGNLTISDHDSKLETVIKTDGSQVLRDLEGDKKVRRVVDPEGRITEYFYSPAGELLAMQMPDGSRYSKLPPEAGGPPNQILRWTKEGTTEQYKETRTVDKEGNLHIKPEKGPEIVRQTDGYERRQEDGKTFYVKELAGGGYVKKNDLHQIVETKDSLGRVRTFGYDDFGNLNRVKYSNNEVWTRQGTSDTWEDNGKPPNTLRGDVKVTDDGTTVDTIILKNGKVRERILKGDGAILQTEDGLFTQIRHPGQNQLSILQQTADGVPQKIAFDNEKGFYWATEDGQTWKKFSTDGKAAGPQEKFKLSIDLQGNVQRENFAGRPPTIELITTDGTKTIFNAAGLPTAIEKYDGSKFAYSYDAASKLISQIETKKDGTIIETDKLGRVTHVKGHFDRTFEYNDKNEITAFTENGKRYAQKEGMPPNVYMSGKDSIAAMISVRADGVMETFLPNNSRAFHLPDGQVITTLKNGAMLRHDKNAYLAETVNTSGYRMLFEHNVQKDVLGRPAMSKITYAHEGGETYTTTDGFNWTRKSNGVNHPHFCRVDAETGALTEIFPSGEARVTLLNGQKYPLHEYQNINNRLEKVREIKSDTWFWRDDWYMRDQAYINQLHDLDPEKIYLLGHNYDPSNPKLLREELVKSVGGEHHFRGIRADGYFARRNLGSDVDAVALMVDRAEQNAGYFSRDRSLSVIRAAEMNRLGSKSEAQRQSIDTSMQRIYGVTLDQHYTAGIHNKNGNLYGDAFYRQSMKLFAEKGRELRTNQEMSKLFDLALGSSNRLDNWATISGEHIATDAHRQHYSDNGGKEKIVTAFTEERNNRLKAAGLWSIISPAYGAYEAIDAATSLDFNIRQANDYLERGKLKPQTALEKATGIFTNSENVHDILQQMSPADQAQYFDGERLSKRIGALTTDEQKAVTFYNEMQEAMRKLHWFNQQRKKFGYESEIGRSQADGIDLTQGVVDVGGHWSNSHQENLSRIENMSKATFARLMEGIGAYPPGETRTSTSGEKKTVTIRSEFQAKLNKGMELNLGSGQYIDKAVELVSAKIEHARHINNIADTQPEKLRDLVPALAKLDPAVIEKALEGYRLNQKGEAGQMLELAIAKGRAEASLTEQERQSLSYFRRSLEAGGLTEKEMMALEAFHRTPDLKRFLDGRQIAKQLEEIGGSLPSEVTKARDQFNGQLSMPAREALQFYQDQLYEAQRLEVRRPAITTLNDLGGSYTVAAREKVLEALASMTAAERQALAKNEPYPQGAKLGYRDEINNWLKNRFDLTSDSSAHKSAQLLLAQIANNPSQLPTVPITSKLYIRENSEYANLESSVKLITDAFSQDKDLQRRIREDKAFGDSFREAARLAVGGSEADFNEYVKPLIETGGLPAETYRKLATTVHAKREVQTDGVTTKTEDVSWSQAKYERYIKQHPQERFSYQRYSFSQASYVSSAVLNADPSFLRRLSKPENAEERDAILKNMTNPKVRALAETIYAQGEVKLEDKLRAFYLDAGVSKEEAKGLLAGLSDKEEERIKVNAAYSAKFGAHDKGTAVLTDLLEKVDKTEQEEWLRLTRAREWSTELTLQAAERALASARTGGISDYSRRFNILPEEEMRAFYKASFEASMNGVPMTAEQKQKHWETFNSAVTGFHKDKETNSEIVVNGILMAGAMAAAPFTGGTSLACLMASAGVMTIGGIAGAGLRYGMLGDTHKGASMLAGDFLRYSIITGTNLLGPQHFAAALRLGSRAGTMAAEQALTQVAIKGITAEGKAAVTEGMVNLVRNGLTHGGGVADDAVKAMVTNLGKKELSGLTAAQLENLGKALCTSLKGSVDDLARSSMREVWEATKQAIKTNSTSAALNVGTATTGNVAASMAVSLVNGKPYTMDQFGLDVSTGVAFSLPIWAGMRGTSAIYGRMRPAGGGRGTHVETPPPHSETTPPPHSETPLPHTDTRPKPHTDTPPPHGETTPPPADKPPPPADTAPPDRLPADLPPVGHSKPLESPTGPSQPIDAAALKEITDNAKGPPAAVKTKAEALAKLLETPQIRELLGSADTRAATIEQLTKAMNSAKTADRFSAIEKLMGRTDFAEFGIPPSVLLSPDVNIDGISRLAGMADTSALKNMLADPLLGNAAKEILLNPVFLKAMGRAEDATVLLERMRQLHADGNLDDFINQVKTHSKGKHPVSELVAGNFEKGGEPFVHPKRPVEAKVDRSPTPEKSAVAFEKAAKGKIPDSDIADIAAAIRDGMPINEKHLYALSKTEFARIGEMAKTRAHLNDLIKNGHPAYSTEQLSAMRAASDRVMATPFKEAKGVYLARIDDMNQLVKKLTVESASTPRSQAIASVLIEGNKLPANVPYKFNHLTNVPLDAPEATIKALNRYAKGLKEAAIFGDAIDAPSRAIMKTVERGVPGLEDWAYLPSPTPELGVVSVTDMLGIDGMFFNLRDGEMRPLDFSTDAKDPAKSRWLVNLAEETRLTADNWKPEEFVKDFIADSKRNAFSNEFWEAIGSPSLHATGPSPQNWATKEAQLSSIVTKIKDEITALRAANKSVPSQYEYLLMKGEDALSTTTGNRIMTDALTARVGRPVPETDFKSPRSRVVSVEPGPNGEHRWAYEFILDEPIISSHVRDGVDGKRIVVGYVDGLRAHPDGLIEMTTVKFAPVKNWPQSDLIEALQHAAGKPSELSRQAQVFLDAFKALEKNPANKMKFYPDGRIELVTVENGVTSRNQIGHLSETRRAVADRNGAPQSEGLIDILERGYASRDPRTAGSQRVLQKVESRLANGGELSFDGEGIKAFAREEPRQWKIGTITEIVTDALRRETSGANPSPARIQQLERDLEMLRQANGRLEFSKSEHRELINRLRTVTADQRIQIGPR